MVVTKTQTLSSFAARRNELIRILTIKIGAAKIKTINSQFDARYSAEVIPVSDLLNAIESKFKKCESIYWLYFEGADHSVLSGSSASLPVEVDCTFIDGASIIRSTFAVDDRLSYKELVDMNFQTFILTIASLYENIVLLTEIFIKKVIVFIPKKAPISNPLHDYLEHLRLLIDLGYRGNDKLNTCISTFSPYFGRYLLLINQLRNRFIHGFSINLESDGFSYYIKPFPGTLFTPRSGDVLIDVFTKEVLDNTRSFISQLMDALKDSTKHHRKFIPA